MLNKLQNPELNPAFNARLFCVKHPNYQAITPTHAKQIQAENAALCELLNTRIARPFSFSVESFYFLLQTLSKHYKIALGLSGHNLLYQAYLLANIPTIVPLIPDCSLGYITKVQIQNAQNLGANCFILPHINEDILTQNPLQFLPQNTLNIIDISYTIPLNLPIPSADILLINGENLGLMRSFGILASKQTDFYGIPSVYLEIQNLYATFRDAISHKRIAQDDAAQIFLQTLQSLLKQQCYCFYPTPANTLCLGLKGIKARDFIQSLIFDNIACINGQECLFGFSKPSFVLRLMGYQDAQARELLSLSFLEVPQTLAQRIAQKVAQKYLQLLKLQP